MADRQNRPPCQSGINDFIKTVVSNTEKYQHSSYDGYMPAGETLRRNQTANALGDYVYRRLDCMTDLRCDGREPPYPPRNRAHNTFQCDYFMDERHPFRNGGSN